MPVPKRAVEFSNLVRAFYESQDCDTSWEREGVVLRVRPRRPLYGTEAGIDAAEKAEGYRIGVLAGELTSFDPEPDRVVVDDSPLSGYPPHSLAELGVPFGAAILFPAWREFVEQELAAAGDGNSDESRPPSVVGTQGPVHRVLLCGDRDDLVGEELRRRRRQLLEDLIRRPGAGHLELPVTLSPFWVRERGLLSALREETLTATRMLLSDEVYLGALRCGYLHLFVDWIGDWNLSGNIDPNQGAVAEVLHAMGDAGRFALGCDKIYVFHYVYGEFLAGLDSGHQYSEHQYRTLGERFTQDENLRCEVLSGGEATVKLPDLRAYQRTRGLLGAHDWSGLLRDLAVQYYRFERPDYLSDQVVRQVVRERLPETRRLNAYTSLVMRTLYGTELFNYDPRQGLRFRRWHFAEALFVDALHLALDDLREYGFQGEGGRTLLQVVDLLSVAQLNERILHRALQEYGVGHGGAEGCKELVLGYLANALDKGYADLRNDQQLLQYRLGVLRVLVVLNAWLKSEGFEEGIGSLKGTTRLDLSRIDATQLYVYGIDLREADLSNVTVPFAHFIECQLQGADLSTAYLPSARLIGGRQTGVKFDRADLTAAIIERGDYRKATFSGASLWAADLSKCRSADLIDQLEASDQNITKRPDTGEAPESRMDLPMLEACLRTFYDRSRGPFYVCRYPGIALKFVPENESSGALSVLFLSDQGHDPKEVFIDRVTAFDAQPRGEDTDTDIGLAYASESGGLFTCQARIAAQEMTDLQPLPCPFGIATRENQSSLKLLDGATRLALWSSAGKLLFIPVGAGETRSVDLDRKDVQANCMLELNEGGVIGLLVGWSDGRLALYNAATGQLRSELPGTSSARSMGHIAGHNQVIVARADSSVDILHLGSGGEMQRLATFQLAHESIHSILCYPDQPRYLISGVARATEEERPPVTLFAMCDATLQVLAVWPFLGKNRAALPLGKFETILHRSCRDIPQKQAGREQQRLVEEDLDKLISWLGTGTLELRRHRESETERDQKESHQEVPERLEIDASKHESENIRGLLELDLRIHEPFPSLSTDAQLSPEELFSVKVGEMTYHLRLEVDLLRFTADGETEQLRRQVRQDQIEVLPNTRTSGEKMYNKFLSLRFRHPLLEKSDTLIMPHGVEARLNYDYYKYKKPSVACMTKKFTPERPNPFRGYALPVQGKNFFAHRDKVENLSQQIMAGGAFVVCGARRSGKSSVLLEAHRVLESNENVFVTRFDLAEEDRRLAVLAKRIVQHIPEALRRKRRSGFDAAFLLKEYVNTPQELLLGAARELEKLKIKNPIIVVMLDEWGHLFGRRQGLDIEPRVLDELGIFYGQLRECIDKVKERYRFVFAGLPWHFKSETLADATKASGLQSYISEWISVPYVNQQVIKDMIHEKLSKELLHIDELTMDLCLEMSSGQMHDANLLMYRAIQTLFTQRKNSFSIEEDELKLAEKHLIDHYAPYQSALWASLDDQTKTWVYNEIVNAESPEWELQAVTENNRPDLKPFFSMAYSRLKVYEGEEEEVLFIPYGLKESIARLPAP